MLLSFSGLVKLGVRQEDTNYTNVSLYEARP